jgi:hypothetical protein
MRYLLPLTVLLLIGCRVAFDVPLPFETTPDPTPTAEISYIGTITPLNSVANVRGCKVVNNDVCPINRALKYGESLNVLAIEGDWYYVELPGIGRAWVLKRVVSFTKF